MLKLMNKKQKTTTNKGFSLVELIVVIAIMAVLVAVLAPAMLRYVENSRKSTDAQTVAGIVTVAQATVIDSNVAPGTYKITVNGTKYEVADAASNSEAKKFEDALNSAYTAATDVKLKSSTWKSVGVTINVEVMSGGKSKITYSHTQNVDQNFADYLDDNKTTTNPTN